MRIVRGMILALPCLLSGCFPIDLDVNDKGELLIPRQEGFFLYLPATGKITQVSGPGGGKPVFARFDPAGDNVLLVVKQRHKDRFIDEFRFELMPLKGGAGRVVHTAPEAGNAQFSPDGAKLAVAHYDSKALARKKPSLHLVDVKAETDRLLLGNAGPYVRWFADSKRLLTFRIHDHKNSEFRGEIVVVDVDSGKVTALAAALARVDSSLDLSPDNRKAIFTANRAGPVGADLAVEKSLKTFLFELDIATGALRALGTPAKYLRYSPDGKKILLTHEPFGLTVNQELLVADADLTNTSVVARDAFGPAITVTSEHLAFPGWIDDQRLYYFTERMVFGSAGKALHLVVIDTTGKNKRFVQPDIDMAIDRLLVENVQIPQLK